VKHSKGAQLAIAVAYGADRVSVTVQDDGSGFENPVGARTARRGGWGLHIMRERAAAYGGTLRVEFPERGTRVVVEMPLTAMGRHDD
jgi:signal transduction histidine kinase